MAKKRKQKRASVDPIDAILFGRPKKTRTAVGDDSIEFRRQRGERFILEYLKTLNAKQSALTAGYSEAVANTSTWRIFKDKYIRRRLAEEFEARRRRVRVTADRILAELASIAFSSITDFASFDDGRVSVKRSYGIPKSRLCAIAEITSTETLHGRNVKIKLHDKVSALDKLCRHLGLLESDTAAGSSLETFKASVAEAMKTAGTHR